MCLWLMEKLKTVSVSLFIFLICLQMKMGNGEMRYQTQHLSSGELEEASFLNTCQL